ncbi:MAG: sensor histidine kinase N-terminal domain-containing protein [Proteobacteria bacterium]|nr:sensor histidine kinase N-terminal domain-containing protein [Pseudomonadota bacterium]
MKQAVPYAPAPSLKRRLSLGISVLVTLMWLMAALISSLHLRQEIDEVSDSALQEVVQRVLPLAYMELLNRDGTDTTADVVAPVGPHREYITYVVRGPDGRVMLQSHDADPAQFPFPPKPGFQDGAETRFYTETAVQGSVQVTAGERPGHRQSAIRHAVFTLLWPLALLFPMVLMATWWLVGRAFVPLLAMGREIEGRGGGNLSPVEAASLPRELKPVAVAVNALLERLRRALEAERSFTANSAHELRTPVAGALAQVQRLIAEVEAPAVRQRARDVEASLRRLARLSEKLLQLAKAEGGALMAHEAQDLQPVLDLVIEDLGAEARIERIDEGTPVLSPMDVDAFAILARNLIENALKHGQPGEPVLVSLTSDGVFRVQNRSAVVPPETLETLLQRFERGASTAEGTGLGLPIVAAIAAGVGSRLDLRSPAQDLPDGMEARVQLPCGMNSGAV